MARPAEFNRHRIPRGRGYLVAGLLLVLMGGLVARLLHIQVSIHDRLDARAVRQHFRREPLPARPGDVLDVTGHLLATSVEAPSLFLDPKAIDKKHEVAESLGMVLGLDADKLLERIERHETKRFLWVKRRLTEDEVRAVRDLKWPASWIGFRTELERCYPQGKVASHVIGMRDIDGKARDGIERNFDALLAGKPGYRIAARDGAGKIIAIQEDLTRFPEHGASVVLTIDSVIQTYVEQTLDRVIADPKILPASVSAIVMNSRTGEILAMANRPTFDPDDPAESSADAWVNRAISDSYEPGSTFKPFIMAAALDWGLISGDERINCQNGEYHMGPRKLHSLHPNGVLTVPEILIKSDNIGMAIIGEKMSNEGLFRAVQSFGFGRPTGIELPGEAAGRVRPLRDWTPYYSTGSVPMGQELAVTPIQLITAFCALANGGELFRPRIVRALVGPDGKAIRVFDKPTVLSRPIQPDTAKFMLEPLCNVVDDEKGTGKLARLAGYSVFGKTGTAQKQGVRGGYAAGHHVSSFIAGAPATDPEIVVLVVVNDPSAGKDHFGGQIAAPATAEILRRTLVYLRIQPDREIPAVAKKRIKSVM